MNNQKIDVIIIGAGLTGLTAAYYLQKSGMNVKLIEKNNRAGGVIQSHYENGFIYETGPNSGVLGSPEAAELFEDLADYCTLETAQEAAKDRWIWKNGKWESLPSGIISGITTPLFKFQDKLNILLEPFRSKGTDPNESVAELVKRRLGKSFLDYAVDPFISGIYAGDPDSLVTKYALPKLYNLEQDYGSFIRGAIKKQGIKKTERDKKATREVFSAKNGLQNLVNALEKSIGSENFYFNSTDIRISTAKKPYKMQFKQADNHIELESPYIITTCGAYALDKMFPDIDSSLISQITSLKYAKVAQIILGYKKWNGMELKSFGGLVPAKENRQILGVLFMSSIFKNRAPEGGALLSVFIGGARQQQFVDYSDEQLFELTDMELSTMLNTNGEKPDLQKAVRYNQAIPQYEISTKERYQAIDFIQKNNNGIILAGNIRDGIGMADRIAQAKKIAIEIIAKS